ncbi:MAG: DUF1624 domain-containing protein [Sedimentisphaerales bacterium]|nr:DUF1624 domain-containing protein [Sedimentisphaerales bacterium]
MRPYYSHYSMYEQRDKTVDILRGVAILIMIAANSSAFVFAEPHPYWFRCVSSVAAPLFVTLAGMMIRFSQIRKNYPFVYFLRRGFMLIAVAVFLDVAAFLQYPCTSFDVLYIIGISAPLGFLFGRIRRTSVQWIVIVAIFLLTPLLQHCFGYTPYPSEFRLDGSYRIVVESQTSVMNHLFIDGWFPVFPWLGFSLLGVMLGSHRWQGGDIRVFCQKTMVLIACACLAVGVLLKVLFPVHLYIRDGFGEVFYPPTVGFVTYTVGILLALFAVFDRVSFSKLLEPLETIGRSSLFLYALHWFAINYVFSLLFEGLDGLRFTLFWLCFAALMTAVAYGLRRLKTKRRQQPWYLRFALGG